MSPLALGLLILLVLVVRALVWWQHSERLLKKYGTQLHFSVGRYLVGLADCNSPKKNVECVVAPQDVVFASLGGQEYGKIPRNAVEEVQIDDTSQVAQRLTATRMLALGVFALAAPKKRKMKERCVVTHWADNNGLKRATAFEFTGKNPEGDANRAATAIMKHIHVPTRRPAPTEGLSGPRADSKPCLFCAETIKLPQ